jgi:hypothetical protein
VNTGEARISTPWQHTRPQTALHMWVLTTQSSTQIAPRLNTLAAHKCDGDHSMSADGRAILMLLLARQDHSPGTPGMKAPSLNHRTGLAKTSCASRTVCGDAHQGRSMTTSTPAACQTIFPDGPASTRAGGHATVGKQGIAYADMHSLHVPCVGRDTPRARRRGDFPGLEAAEGLADSVLIQ